VKSASCPRALGVDLAAISLAKKDVLRRSPRLQRETPRLDATSAGPLQPDIIAPAGDTATDVNKAIGRGKVWFKRMAHPELGLAEYFVFAISKAHAG
jgi:hypothetical protein